MAWTLDYNTELGILEATLIGSLSGEDLHDLTTHFIAMLYQRKANAAYVDLTQLTTPPPMEDIYELPARQYIDEGMNRNVRIALGEAVSPSTIDAAAFYETVCLERGWVVQVFPGREQAIAWLTNRE